MSTKITLSNLAVPSPFSSTSNNQPAKPDPKPAPKPSPVTNLVNTINDRFTYDNKPGWGPHVGIKINF